MILFFEQITFKNFLSTGNNETTIQLDAAPTTLIVGANGSGKCLRGNTKINIRFVYNKTRLGYKKFVNTEQSLYETELIKVVEFYKLYPDEIGNIEVNTRFGFKAIEWADITAYNSTIIRIVSGSGNYLEGSPDHLVMANNTWTKLADINIGDTLIEDLDKGGDIDGSYVTSIQSLPFQEDLYDLQVANVKEFYANGIVSHNSTMLDALSFVLFNKPHRNISKPQLVNSINNKNCLVTINFRIGEVKYKIIRGIKPNIFEIWQNGVMLNQESHSRDYQKLLETNILKLNHKSFHQVVVLGSSNFIPFMQLTTYQRRGVIEDLLDIGIFTKMNSVLKESVAKQRDTIKDTDYQISLITEKIRLQTRHLDELQSIDKRNSKNFQDDLDQIEFQINDIVTKNNALSLTYQEQMKPTRESLALIQKSFNSLTKFGHGIESNIKKIVSDAKFYEEHDICPTCSQAITSETKSNKLKNCKHKAVKLNVGYAELKQTLNKTTQSLNETNKLFNELSQIPNQIASNNNVISSYNSRISFLNKQLKSDVDNAGVDLANTTLLKAREDKITLSELRLTQIEDRTYSDVIAELLKDTGIKTKIIKQYLPVMNQLINQYLQILDFFISFNLDESFNETIKSRHHDHFSYASFSEGEKTRIDLSLLFAWRTIAKLKNSANTNLLILDEVMDSSLDGDGLDNLTKMLDTVDSTTRVFIISHKNELKESSIFNRKLEFHKVKNFSQLVEDI